MTLIIAPLRFVPDVIKTRSPSHVLTIIGPDTTAPVCSNLNHLTLRANDIVNATPGLIAPDPILIQSILDFADIWQRRAPMLIHCLAGISRSTAAAYILVCAATPPGAEDAIAVKLRTASPTATPNLLMVALADDILERDGAMVMAVKRIGRGAEAMEGVPFDFVL